MLKMWT